MLESVKTTPSNEFFFVPDQTRTMEDDWATKCVTRRSADATPGNFKKKLPHDFPERPLLEPTLNIPKNMFFDDLRKGCVSHEQC